LTQESNIEATEAEGEGEESATFADLRRQLKEAQKELKSRPDRDTLTADIRSQLERDTAIESALVQFGHPKGILDVVKGKLGDAEVTPEGVAEALTSIGYVVDVEGAASSQGEVAPATQPDALANVTQLGQQVRSAAESGSGASVEQRIAGAKTRDELAAIAEETGILGHNANT